MVMLPALVLVAATVGQQAVIQNGRVNTRQVTSIAAEVDAHRSSAEPVWIVWSVPMVDGDRSPCSTWSDGGTSVRGERLEPRPFASERSQVAAPAGPVRLESGTTLLVLLRVVNGQLDRLRVVGDDCPVDAGGRDVYWLTGITPTESVRFLETLAHPVDLAVASHRRLAESAVSALSYHRDSTATAALDRLTTAETDRALRRQAAVALAATRGTYGFERVTALLTSEPDRTMRQGLVAALSDSPQPAATDALSTLARTDPDAGVRGEAAYRYIRRAGQAAIGTATALLSSETDDGVKRRVVAGLGTLPPGVSTPILIDVAKSNRSLAVRKEAVTLLGRSHDPKAMTFLEEVVGR